VFTRGQSASATAMKSVTRGRLFVARGKTKRRPRSGPALLR
jgi:hypothetical protein